MCARKQYITTHSSYTTCCRQSLIRSQKHSKLCSNWRHHHSDPYIVVSFTQQTGPRPQHENMLHVTTEKRLSLLILDSIQYAVCMRPVSRNGAGVQETSHSLPSSTARRTISKPALIWQAWPITSHDSLVQERDVIDPNDVTHSIFADYPVLPGSSVPVSTGDKYPPAPVRPTALAYSSPHNAQVLPFGRLLLAMHIDEYSDYSSPQIIHLLPSPTSR